MRANCKCAGDASRKRRRAMFGSWAGIAIGLGAALVPKCPFCIAAYLSLLGLGTAAAGTLAPLLFPFGILLVTLSIASMAFLMRRSRHLATWRDWTRRM